MKIGLISNRRSRRNQRKLSALETSAPQGVEILHRRLEGVDGLSQVLDEFASAETSVVAVNGGDGTVSAVLTDLFERRLVQNAKMYERMLRPKLRRLTRRFVRSRPCKRHSGRL